jgi:hypothetical protein
MYVKPEAYQAHYRRISASKAAEEQAEELFASQKQQEQQEMAEARMESKQAEYEQRQYQKLLARHPAPPPPPPTACLTYNWRCNCNPDGPALDEDEYQPNYVDPCDPHHRYETQPLSAPVTRPATVKNISSGSQGSIQIGYDQASNAAPDAEAGC